MDIPINGCGHIATHINSELDDDSDGDGILDPGTVFWEMSGRKRIVCDVDPLGLVISLLTETIETQVPIGVGCG